MGNPEDRVLVAAITRRSDLRLARRQGWYRIPLARLPGGVPAEYLAFFTAARVAGRARSGIYWYARLAGVELHRRSDLLPQEWRRADELYYKVQLADWQERAQPVLNPEGRAFAFIHSTWDRFCRAQCISDLTSQAPGLVKRDLPLRPRLPAPLPPSGVAGRRRLRQPAWRQALHPLLDGDCRPPGLTA